MSLRRLALNTLSSLLISLPLVSFSAKSSFSDETKKLVYATPDVSNADIPVSEEEQTDNAEQEGKNFNLAWSESEKKGLENLTLKYLKLLRTSSGDYLRWNENVHVLVRDMQTGEDVISIDADNKSCIRMASLVKIFISQMYFEKFGGYRNSNEENLMVEMIVHSNNYATNQLFDILGGPKVVDSYLHKAYGGKHR